MPPPRRITLSDGSVYDVPDDEHADALEAIARSAGLIDAPPPREVPISEPFVVRGDAPREPVAPAPAPPTAPRLVPSSGGTDADLSRMLRAEETRRSAEEAVAAADEADADLRYRDGRLAGTIDENGVPFDPVTVDELAGLVGENADRILDLTDTLPRTRVDVAPPIDADRAGRFFVRPGGSLTLPGAPAALPGAVPAGVPSDWIVGAPGSHAGLPETATDLEIPAWAPSLDEALPGEAPLAAPAPGRRRGRRRAPAAAPAPVDEGAALVDLLTDRPRGTPLFDEARETPLDRRLARNDEARRLAQRRAEIEAAGYADTADALRGAEAARADLEDQRRRAMGEARDRYRAAMDRAAAMTIDPEGWWHDRGVGGTIAGAIAIGLGSLGGALSGSNTNEALSIINESIGRDLEAQAQRIDSARYAAEGEGTLLELMSSEFSSREAALAAARAAALEEVANQIAMETAGLEGSEIALQAAEMRDTILSEAQAAAAAALEAEQDRALDLMLREAQAREAMADAIRAERRAMGGSGGPSYEEPTDARLNAANRLIDSGVAPATAAESVGIDPALLGGSERFAESSSADSAANVAALSSSLDEIERLMGGPDDDAPGVGMTGRLPDFLLSAEGQALRVEIENATDLLGRLRSGGAISAEEEARFSRILTGAGTDAALRRGVERVRREVEARTHRSREGGSLDADTSAFIDSLLAAGGSDAGS